ncbi:MAG: hypothetical protein ACI89L_001854 [Phycisphaerales bacterium]|jgi:hypothetical protein
MTTTTTAPSDHAPSDHAPHRAPAHTRLLSVLLRYAIPLLALLAAGPIAYTLSSGLASPTGGPDTSFLLSGSMGGGLKALLISLALAAVFAAAGAVLLGAKGGLICAGYVLGWAAWGTGDVTMALRGTVDLSAMTLIVLSVEGLLFAVACVAMLILTAKLDRHHSAPLREVSARSFAKELVSIGALLPVLAAAAAAIVVAALVAQSGLKGQTLFAAMVAGIAASIAAHSASTSESPHPYAPFIGVALAAVVAPLIAIGYPGVGELPKGVVSGNLLGFARVSPADWAVALLIGVPVGLGWTGTLLPRHEIPA